MPLIPLTTRRAMHSEQTGEVEVMLVTVTHPNLDAPVRVSSDPTQRLSVDPLRYGTISNGVEYPFVLMSAILPDDTKGSPPRTALVFDNIDSDMVALARSFINPATADIDVVLASAPDFVTQRYAGLKITRSNYDETSVTFDLSREHLTFEPFGARQTKVFFPGLHGIASA
jgi:hypothetical protein